MASPNGQFLDLNAAHPNITRIRPGVVRRNRPAPPEPDRSMVEGFVPTPPSKEPEPVAAKKKKKARARVDANIRAIAVARVEKLIAADNPVSKATASVAKELGVSESAVTNWRTAARKAVPAKPAKRASKKAASRRAAPSEGNGSSREALAHDVLTAFAAWLDSGVREVVRQEIRRMLA
jgi:hypothetical protein